MAGAATVSFLLEKLWQLLDSNDDFIFGAEDELRQLEKEVVLLKAILERPSNMEGPLREMERRIRDFVYDAEDTIDSCMSQRSVKGNPMLAQDLRSLREGTVKPLLDFAASLQIGNESGKMTEGQNSWKLVKQAPEDSHGGYAGFDDEVSVLVGYLVPAEPRRKLDVVSILGGRGLGKTTLAWEIFKNQQKIEYEYPTRIWLNISQGTARDHVLSIVKAFTSRDVTSMSDQQLGKTVCGYLREEKFLLILDNVWGLRAWDPIRRVLPGSNNMSKVLITTREFTVAQFANRSKKPHRLRILVNEESWQLLQLQVFGELDKKCPKELELVGREIVDQCNGSVLATLLIGGILKYQCSMPVNNETINAWSDMSNILRKMWRDNLDGNIPRIISLAYDRLPKDLRVCFLYLAVFPKDYEISTWTLTQLWIAEGLIRHNNNNGRTLEEVAEDNLKNLINRNLLTIRKRNSLGQVKTCRLHSLVRELCIFKAGVWEDDLFLEITFRNGCFVPPVSQVQEVRRICIYNHLSEVISAIAAEKIYSPYTRSLLCFNEESIPPEYVSVIPTHFKLLRFLESKSIRFSRFPMKLSKLIHLRYITLSYENLRVLPEPISALRNLQTLVLDTSSPTLEVKANIWGMTQLRHLKTKASIVLAIQGGGEGNGGQNLQTLSRLSPENCTIQVFNRIPNLKRLGIRGKLATFLNDTSGCRLERLNRLVDVKLMNDSFISETQPGDRLARLPPLDFFPPVLKRLTLSATYLDWTEMSVLGKINTLEVLKLKNNAFTGMCWQAHGNNFSRLRFLLIAKADFVHWECASSGCFRSLTQLVLKNCQNLIEIPICLAESLTILDIEHLNKPAVEYARKIKEEGGRLKLTIGPGCG